MVSKSTLLDLNRYTELYFKNGVVDSENQYVKAAPRSTVKAFSGLTKDPQRIDDALEWALFAYYGDIKIANASVRAQAEEMLPHDNRKLASLRLGSALVQAINNMDALKDAETIARYKAMISSICRHNKITLKDIDQFYQKAKPSEPVAVTRDLPVVVQAEPQASFLLEDMNYMVDLRRLSTGGYELSYKKKPDISAELVSGKISAISLKELLRAVQSSYVFTTKSLAQITKQANELSKK